MDYLLGVDAGNSKTIALVAEAAGRIVGWGRRGCGDISNPRVGERAALDNVAAAIGVALEAVGISPERLAGRAFAMAGADWPEDFAFLEAELGLHPWGRGAAIVNDAVGALRSGPPGGVGVAVVCGTYATSAARAADGRTWHASFWQEPGGGFALADRALRAIFRTELGIDPPTSLTGAALGHFGLDRVEELLHTLTGRDSTLSESEVARFAPAVLDAAARGDPTARHIISAQGTTLGDYALAAARQVGLGGAAFDLVLAGGVFRHPSSLLRDALLARVESVTPGTRLVKQRFEPAVGALLLALEQTGAAPTPGLLERLAATTPPRALFQT